MKKRSWKWLLLCLLCGAGAWFLWHQNSGRDGSLSRPHQAVASAVAPAVSRPGVINTNATQISLVEWNTNKLAGRLSNTTQPLDQLVHDGRAILLENALIDTRQPANFVFPQNLQPPGDPGAYIVQARGPIDNAFRALLAQSGATVVSYIPNNAYLVRASAGVAGTLEASPPVQAVIPYEPYYKIQSALLWQAVGQMILPDQTVLNLGLFADAAPATISQITKLGGQIVGQDQSPFGPVVRVVPPRNWTALAVLPGVQIVEPFYRRATANDLARATNGVAANSLVPTNYMYLTGSNIIVEVNDTGIDAQHPDFSGGGPIRVIGDAPQSLVDTNGHGTHVAGIIAGDGTKSPTVTNAPGSTLVGGKGSAGQFRGMAPGAILYSVGGIQGGADTNFISDQYFQEVPALTNALISNNSWVYEGNGAYDLAAASYDAAVRDALPTVTGSQPVLFVFAAGNAGNGSDSSDFGGGTPDSIESPATAKNVITVGAIQEDRNITNTVTNAEGQISAPWQPETSTSYRVAGFSSRGNVGIGTEGTFGRYKPDVVAPGTFIISTRSEQWDINSYFYQSPTNDQSQTFSGFTVQPGSIVSRPFPFIPSNSVQLVISTYPNANSPFSFAVLPTLMGLFTSPGYQFISTNDPVFIPPDPNAPTIQQILNSGQGFTGAFNFAISNNTSSQVIFDLRTDILTTNGTGNYFLVLSNLNNSIGTPNSSSTGPGPYYRYETGTSMSTPMVSGMLALLQQFYVNAYHTNPSPAMLKAMVVNGARATGFYDFNAQNSINYEGWGLINLPNSLPPGMTNQLSTACSDFIQDQNPTNALATGDSQTFFVNTTNAQPLRVTLAWTDPPGDPAAAIKLVNNLVLVVTNLSNPASPVVYYGNDIPASSTFNSARNTNTPPVIDSINNVQNVYLPTGAGTSFSVTVMGYRVNVNAVTAQTNNVVQDYALVISCGNGQLPSVMMVTTPPASYVTNPTGDQDITVLSGTNNNTPLLNQFVGASSPLLGTNTIPFNVTAPEAFGTNWQVTVGMTNQWHFYVVTNTFGGTNSAFTNAAFITFIPDTLSVPRMGVFAGSVANATRPEADIDLYVASGPNASGLTNLDPTVISNCVVLSTQVGQSVGGIFRGVSLGRGGTEFVVDTNSQPNQVYYVGVKSEDQMASEYGFISIFSQTPFSQMNNGNQVVNGVPVPVNIPDGSPAHPGNAYVFGLAIYPITVGLVTVGDIIQHQNFGDLIGKLTFNGGSPDVLNNHDSLYNSSGFYTNNYDDSQSGTVPGSRPSDGPGSLNNFAGDSGMGVWMLTEVDDSLTQTGSIQNFNMTIQPHQDLKQGAIFAIPPGSWFYGFIDVPPGATNLTVTATNYPPAANPPLELFVKLGALPTTNSFDGSALINTPGPAGPWGSVSLGPPLTSGRYWVGIFNPSSTTANGIVFATVGFGTTPAETIYSSSGPVPLLDDAVTTDSITVPDDQTISSLEVALRVQHPRVSDLVFHLIGPDGTRDLLVENRGGTDPNGMGATLTASNSVVQSQTFSGGPETSTNVINTGQNSGTLTISYNFFSLPDELAVYDGGVQIFDSGLISGSGVLNIPYTGTSSQLTIVMNPFGNSSGPGDAWTFTVNGLGPAYAYLVLTEDTNKTTTPIKFAVPPFVPGASGTNVIVSDFETAAAGDYTTTVPDETTWTVLKNQVSVVNDPANAAAGGTNYLALANGTISNTLPTVAGRTYALTFRYRGPGAVSLWRGESNANDSIGSNPGIVSTITYASGEVGSAFAFNGVSSQVRVPASASLNVGTNNSGFTLDAWVNPADLNARPIFEWNSGVNSGPDAPIGVHMWASASGPGSLYGNIKDTSAGNGSHYLPSSPGIMAVGVFQHVAMTYNKTTGVAVLYRNGVSEVTSNFVGIIPQTSFDLYLGFRPDGTGSPDHFLGDVDEASLYDRPLSASEIEAIFNTGPAGKFDTNAPSVAQGLAEALVSVNGSTPVTFSGDNNNWQTKTIVFTATQAATPLQLTGVEPGMLLDSFSLSQVGGDLFYLPEQSLDAYDGLNAGGTWTLEIQDDRVGATNNATLLSWQLRFNYVTTGTSPNGTPSGTTVTNIIPPGGIAYYPVNVPTNADGATNILIFASAPVNMWFNQTTFPVGANPPDTELLTNATNGTAVLTLTSVPPLLPGQTYYIGLQNTNTVPVTNVFQVNFHLVFIPASGITSGPSITFTNSGGTNGILLTWFALTNYQYQIEYTTTLLPPIPWTIIPGVVVTNLAFPVPVGGIGEFQYFDDGSLTGGFGPQKFYRLIAYPPGTTIPPALVISTVTASPGGLQIQWHGSTNYIYDVLWTTNLVLPTASWNVLTNLAMPVPLNYGGGVFTFTDNGSLTGGSAAAKFFRVQLWP